MLYLLRCTERGKEPHAGKSKLRHDIARSLLAAVPEARLSFDTGRIYVETERDIHDELARLHGVNSFSPCSVCEVDGLTPHIVALAQRELAPEQSFYVKVHRVGEHPFSSREKAAELGAKILECLPGTRVDLHRPDLTLAVEIRDHACFVFTQVIPGRDARGGEAPPATFDLDGSPETTHFLVDAMLGTLASRLRALGFDTAWRRDTADSLLLREAAAEARVVLTQDRELAEIGGPAAYFVRAKTVDLQLAEVIERFALAPSEATLFTRCSVCNTPLVPIEKATVAGRVPPRAYDRHDAFWTCTACDKIYWKGSHYDEMLAVLRATQKPSP